MYRVLLKILVTVASAETSFFMKLLKSYSRFIMSQAILNDLVMLAIENNILESTDYEELMNNFISKNVMKASQFMYVTI